MYTLKALNDLFRSGKSALQKQARLDKKREKMEWMHFRFNYLTQIQNECGIEHFECEYCTLGGLELDGSKSKKGHVTIDHFVPVSRGGSKFDPENFVLACVTCNQNKSDMTFDEWMRCGGRDYLEKRIKRLEAKRQNRDKGSISIDSLSPKLRKKVELYISNREKEVV